MTVCIAASCESGKRVVAATDGRLSFAGIAADAMLGKMLWKVTPQDEWLFLFAGEPSNTKAIFEEMYWAADGASLTRENIQKITLEGYQRRWAKFSSFAALAPYDMDLAKFKAEGRAQLGEQECTRISRQIAERAVYFEEQLLVIGWGKSEYAAMLYEVSPDGDRDHALAGIAAIGTGAEVAASTLLLLGQTKDSTLAETLYCVAAAKFAAEKSQGDDVGKQHTAMCITRKRTPEDKGKNIVAEHVPEDGIAILREVWERYGRPRIPMNEGWNAIAGVVKKLGFEAGVSPWRINEIRQLAARMSEPGR
ncbi:MAG: hypothetical protein LAN37_15915 [Acidobacteriia bacterium]|nr:hypothetical protein [Terriglobia bacterium]